MTSFNGNPSNEAMLVRDQNPNSKTKSLINQPRASARLRDKQLKETLTSELLDAITAQSQVNGMFNKELRERPTHERLEHIKVDLQASLKYIYELHDNLKAIDPKTDKALVHEVDRITHDNKLLVDRVERFVSNMQRHHSTFSVRSSHKSSHSSIPTSITLGSCRSPSSIVQSHSSHSKSTRSTSSRASSIMKIMQLEAKANIAAMKSKLRVTKEAQELQQKAQELEQKAQELERVVVQKMMQAEIDAAEAKEQVISQGLEEEEIGLLLHPPSTINNAPAHLTTNPSCPITVAPNTSASQPELMANQFNQTSVPQNLYSTGNSIRRPTQSPIANSPLNISTSSCEQQAFANTLAQAIHSVKLKPAEPTIFYGDPLTYIDWKVAFEGLIEGVHHSPLQKLAYLQQYLGGKAREAVSGYFQIGTEEAFRDAKRKLETRFGQPYVISEAYRSKLDQWPVIREHDGEALQQLADFLESCKTAMQRLSELRCLNDRRENVKILEKLPLSIGRRWAMRATQMECSAGEFPTLNEFCAFLSQEANVATSSLSKALARRASPSGNGRPKQTHTGKGVTTLLTADYQNPKNEPKHVKYPCLFCNMNNHTAGICFQLGKQPHTIIEQFFRDNNLCFSCSKPGHKKDQCRYPATCHKKDCGQQHLTVLHDYYSRGNRNKTSPPSQQPESDQSRGGENKTSQPTPTPTNNQSAATARNCIDNNRPANLTSWTVPVYVSRKENPKEEILVYALLDSGSNRTFITQNILQKLNAPTHDTDMNISTLTDVNGSESNRQASSGLLVRGYNKQKCVELPPCISQSKIPYNPEEIPNTMSVQDWPHLNHLASEFITVKEGATLGLGLLIGNNLPQVFISRQEVSRGDHEPFARLTDLGWTLMGNTARQSAAYTNPQHSTTIVNRAVSYPTTRSNISFKVQADDDYLESKILKILSSDFHFKPADSAKALIHDAISICKEGNLRLHKISSNSSDLLQSLPATERNVQDIQILDPEDATQPLERTLGLIWSLKSDTFEFSSSLKLNPDTRRGVLSTIASIYDPLGFLSPHILQGKNILQDMCRIAASWDSPLTGDLLSRWESWKSSLSDLSNIDIKRCYKPADFGDISKAKIHHFSDASTCGYGEVSYLRLVNTEGKVHCSFLVSKARVASLKPVTIPRLELQAAVTSSFINAIRNVIAIRGPIREIWCDQGTNFVGAIPDLTEKGVLEFKLNPPTASHMGGVWERMIRSARNVLQNLLRKHSGRLDTSSLRTLMCTEYEDL